MVTPDGHLLDIGDLGASLEGELGEGTVVIETGHGREVLSGEVWGVALADESVGVGGVADGDRLAVTRSVVVDGLTNGDKDLTVVLEEVSALHTWATGLGTDEEVVVNISEGGGEVGGADDFVEEGEGAIVKLSLDTLEDLLLVGEIQEVEDDALVLAKELTTTNIEANTVRRIIEVMITYEAILKTME